MSFQKFCISVCLIFQVSWVSAQNVMPISRSVPEDELLVLLDKGNYIDLAKKLQSLQSAYSADSNTENEIHKAFYQFYRVDAKVGRSLDKWVAQQPENAMAHLARGMYRTKMGWFSRGSKFASLTKTSQFANMTEWFSAAKTDLNLSLQIAPSLVEPYCYLIEIDMTEGNRHAKELYDRALKINPNSFIAREFYLHSQLPRWGGSYEAMEKTILSAKPFYAKTPRLETLEGRANADLGELAAYHEDYQSALKYYATAISKGDFWFTNQSYGETLAETGNHALAIDKYSRVIREKPGFKKAWWMRAISYKALRQYPEALADITYAINIEPQDDAVLATRAGIYGLTGELTLALKDLEMAAKLNSSNPDYPGYISKIKNAISKVKSGS
jgi:tetratricopeptide (TPR) repeat protein